MRLPPGARAPHFHRPSVTGEPVDLEDYRGRRLLLSFYRFSGCPFCNLRVHRLLQVLPELEADGLSVIAFFQSPAESILAEVGRQQPPFPIIADPEKEVYAAYGIERSGAAVARAAVRRMSDAAAALAKGFVPSKANGELALIPADFLIDEELIIREAYYGADIGDHLPFERIRAFLSAAKRAPAGAAP